MEPHRERELEEALADSENRFRCLIECASEGYLLYDGAGRVMDGNASGCESYGYSRAEIGRLSLPALIDRREGGDALTAGAGAL